MPVNDDKDFAETMAPGTIGKLIKKANFQVLAAYDAQCDESMYKAA